MSRDTEILPHSYFLGFTTKILVINRAGKFLISALEPKYTWTKLFHAFPIKEDEADIISAFFLGFSGFNF